MIGGGHYCGRCGKHWSDDCKCKEPPRPDWDALTSMATDLYSALHAAIIKCPEESVQHASIGKLAYELDYWCRLVEENHGDWDKE